MVLRWQNWNSKIVLDAPLLFERKPLEYFCFPIVAVGLQNREQQVERLMCRNNFKREEAERRIDSQMPMEQKMEMGDIAIVNSGSFEDL